MALYDIWQWVFPTNYNFPLQVIFSNLCLLLYCLVQSFFSSSQFSNTVNLYTSLGMNYQVLHPNKTTSGPTSLTFLAFENYQLCLWQNLWYLEIDRLVNKTNFVVSSFYRVVQ